ncbi:MAG: conjugal transfer protein TraF [Rhodocyclaceae bacterium]|nr:conjugal transfer protein TraF [Rhodocyclaceae bacterium]
MSAFRSVLTFLLALFTALPAIAAHAAEPATAQPPDPAETATVYWQQHREGWFWYRDPPPPTARPFPKAPATPARPRELADFEAMQQRLEMLKRVAVMNPSDDNLMAYMRFQRVVMDRSQVFADRWQRLVWREPSLDYASDGRPTNTLAIAAFDERQRERDTATVRQLATTHGLIFVFRGDCPFCHRFAPVLKRFAQQHGLTVLAVSLDGGTLPEYLNARPDNGIAARLNARAVPALYLTQPSRREFRPVGFGLMSDTDLLERIAALAREADPTTPPTASRTTP